MSCPAPFTSSLVLLFKTLVSPLCPSLIGRRVPRLNTLGRAEPSDPYRAVPRRAAPGSHLAVHPISECMALQLRVRLGSTQFGLEGLDWVRGFSPSRDPVTSMIGADPGVNEPR